MEELNVEYKMFLVTVMLILLSLVPHVSAGKSCIQLYGKRQQCKGSVPKDLWPGITEVVLEDFPLRIVRSSLFEGNGWDNITLLTISSRNSVYVMKFEEKCFQHTPRLQELRLHVASSTYSKQTFLGTDNVRLLDLTNSSNLFDADIRHCVFSDGAFPNLETLILARVGQFELDQVIWRRVASRPISYIDVSYNRIMEFNFTAMFHNCQNIKTLKMKSFYSENNIEAYFNTTYCNIEHLDFSDIIIPMIILICNTKEVSASNITIDINRFAFFSTVKEMTLNNICPNSKVLHYFRHSKDIRFSSKTDWQMESLSFTDNKLASLDLEIVCPHPMLSWLSLARNQMEYFNPQLANCVSTLQTLDLSDNNLGLMNERNASDFEILLQPLRVLRNISLARNGLTSIPREYFVNNTGLEVIDLSGNSLEQVHFKVSHLSRLKTLELSNNDIRQLDKSSRAQLDLLMNTFNVSIGLSNNPFACGRCDDLESVKWLIRYNDHLSERTGITCTAEEGTELLIDIQAIQHVEELCQRPIRIALGSVVGVLGLCLIATAIILLRRRFVTKQAKRRRQRLIYDVQNERPGHEFVAFLSYSSADGDAVERYIIPPLEETLQSITGIDRNLLCIGDKEFRVGFPIHDELVRCINRSCVVISVVSDSFSKSDFCNEEFLQAREMKKPVILMVQEACDEDLMSPLLRESFKRNTRVIWLTENDQFTMKTTWDNVAESILHLAANI